MAYNSKNLKTDASGVKPLSQVYDPALDDLDVLTGASLGNNRYGMDVISWGMTPGGVYVPVQVDANGIQQMSLAGSNATIGNVGLNAGTNTIGAASINLADSSGSAYSGGIGDATGGAHILAVAQTAYNGVNYDRVRNNTQGTLLASAARTGVTSCPTQTNYNARGIVVNLNVTVASGTGGLQVIIRQIDPITGSADDLHTYPSAVTTTGTNSYVLYPGVNSTGGSVRAVYSIPLPRSFIVTVVPGDSSSYTYSVGYSLIN